MRFILFLLAALPLLGASRPNVLWIYVDDMSDWLGCYGHTAVPTPNIDALAAEGTRFDRAYMPAPVCSATRSALITGMMQTSLGLHHHRTMIKKPLPKEIRTLPAHFRRAGYVTFNEAKDDYNFDEPRLHLYSHEFGTKSYFSGDLEWISELKEKPFFGQIQLKGGKLGGETGAKFPSQSRVDPATVDVPPFYPDTKVFRDAIARHYEQVAVVDAEVGAIIAALKKNDLFEITIVVFFTDHGSPLPREKQNLYEAGLKVPLIFRGPGIPPGKVRKDLVSGIDISSTSLSFLNLRLPKNFEGGDLFDKEYKLREFVIGARDRLGVAIDRVRTVRTDHFRYIRNYHADRPVYQLQYREKYATLKELRKLYDEGGLSPVQAWYHDATQRPREELYDLRSDPYQVKNLAADPSVADELERHRKLLEGWENETGDMGRVPASRDELEAVYKLAKGKVANPEYDFLKK